MDIEKIKQELLEKKAKIIEALENNTKESQNEKSGVEDTADEVTAELTRETLYKLSQTEREKLFLIEIALKKIESGTYGICEECGEPIGEKRHNMGQSNKILCIPSLSNGKRFKNRRRNR
jgi:DnaK suppressor protein